MSAFCIIRTTGRRYRLRVDRLSSRLCTLQQCNLRLVSSVSTAVKNPVKSASVETIVVPRDLDEEYSYSTVQNSKNNSFIKDVMELSKFRLSALVVSTTSAGFLAAGMAGGATLAWPTLASCCLGTALCSSSASTWNQILEVDRDSQMKRTRQRPLVKKSFTKSQATILASATGFGGAAVLALGTDPVTTALGIGNIGLYAGLYTYLKPRHEINTWVGAVVGAVPPVMGWTAAGGNLMDTEALLLGSLLYLWQMPHFFALSWMHRVDYARGGFQMVPVNDMEFGDRTASLITRYTWYLSAIPFASYALDVTSSMFPLEGILLNAYALHVARKFNQNRSNANARKVFLTSLWYLPCLMTLFILHSKTWDTQKESHKEDDKIFKLYKDMIKAIRQKGRDLCIHEIVTQHIIEDAGGDEHAADAQCPFTVSGKEKVSKKAHEIAQEASSLGAVLNSAPALSTNIK